MSAGFRIDAKTPYGFDHVLQLTQDKALTKKTPCGCRSEPAEPPVAAADAQTRFLNFLGRVV